MTRSKCRALLALLCLAVGTVLAQVQLKRIALAGHDTRHARWLVLSDLNRNGLGEIVYRTYYGPIAGWEIVEYRPFNRYELVKADTGSGNPGDSLEVGIFYPCGAGDIDRDGRSDLVGTVAYNPGPGPDSVALCTVESRDSTSYPDSLNWFALVPDNATNPCAPFFYDLDGDSADEIAAPWGGMTAVFENVGADRESLVCEVPHGNAYGMYVFGDFDQNNKPDCAFMYGSRVDIFEHDDGDRYAKVCSLRVGFDNTAEIFSGHDTDRNGRPEFFVVFAYLGGLQTVLHLYQFEAVAEHDYRYYSIDTTLVSLPGAGVRSVCTDLDGDGVEEVIWAGSTHIIVLRGDGEHRFQRCGYWPNDLGTVTWCNTADYNGNGYPEIYVGGDSLLSVLEIEAIRLDRPNAGHAYTVGDTCAIRWQVFQTPRCDSVSLLLRSDTNTVNGFYRLDTIATGLSPTESTYSWVVPDTALDSARIVAVAYGPGWQFDESDSAFSIVSAGVAQTRTAPPRSWSLSVTPNPARGAFNVRYGVPHPGRVSVGAYDVDGRLVRALPGGDIAPGRYEARLARRELPAGIYFVRLTSGARRDASCVVKVVLSE
jgi:hypothetical protein